jgi:hypothetical protein
MGSRVFRASLVLVFVTAGGLRAQTGAGYILKSSGSWTAAPDGRNPHPIKAGDTIQPGDWLASNPPDATLGLVLFDGTYLKCGKAAGGAPPARCAQPIRIPPPAETPGILRAFLDRLENRALPPVAFVTSRGVAAASPIQLKDAVLLARGTAVDLAPALSSPPPTALHLLLTPIDRPDTCAVLDVPLPAAAHSVSIAGLKPQCTLYELSATDESMEGAYPATVLFASAGNFARADRLLKEASALVAGWQSASEEEKRTFLRVVLWSGL